MPLYYSPYRVGGKLIGDIEGAELADDDTDAARQAMLAAGDTSAHVPPGEPVARDAEFDVTDGEGHHLYSFPFSFTADNPIR